MANTHHRKKHKQRLQHYNHKQDTVTATTKSRKASIAFGIIGGLAGCLIGYFASQGSPVWTIAGIAVGAVPGYLAGAALDKQAIK